MDTEKLYDRDAFLKEFDAVVTDFGDQKTEQTGQIVFLFLQVSQVPLIVIPVALDQQPPDGVTAHPVHPARQRRCIADKIKAFRYHSLYPKTVLTVITSGCKSPIQTKRSRLMPSQIYSCIFKCTV